MPQGYLVTLGNNSLNANDAISAAQSTFVINTNIGAGSWTWTGVWENNGSTYNNITDTGVYYTGTDGNVYFVPDTWTTTSGTAIAVNPPAYTAGDDTVSGTGGDDVIDNAYTDSDGDVVTTGNDTIEAGAGNDTVYGSGGEDDIAGGDGNDTLHGDAAAGTAATTTVSWVSQGLADETDVSGGLTATSANGDVQVQLTVNEEANFTSASMETNDVLYDYNNLSDTSSLEIYGGAVGGSQDAATITMDFSAAASGFSNNVSDVTFGIFDLDELSGQFADQVIITAYGPDGVTVIPVTLSVLSPATIALTTNLDGSSTATAITGVGGANPDAVAGFVQVFVAGPVSSIVIDYNNVDTAYGGHAIRIGDLQMTSIPSDGDADTISGDAGDDIIYGNGGDDLIFAGSGGDTVDGGAGNDSVIAGIGDDLIILEDAFGVDNIDGGEDVSDADIDVLDASAVTTDITLNLNAADNENGTLTTGGNVATFTNIETVALGSGDDTVTGSSGEDSIITGAGDDVVTTTGTGADTFETGAGNDTINFSEGDSIDGGTGDDTFTFEDLPEPTNDVITIVGGQGGETADDSDPLTLEGDTLNLGFDADMSTLNITSTVVNADGNTSYAGSVTMDDGTLLNFSEIENIICFTPGTRIATPKGARDIATLKVGDLVVTRDHGLQPIRWIQHRTLPATGNFAPIRIRPGVVTGQDRDLLVSPQHRMMFQGYRAELLFGESEVLVAAKNLIDGKLVTRDEGGDVTYIHMMFNEHEVVYAEGAATESFLPGKVGLSAVSDPAREELFALFPDLRSNVEGYGPSARRCLRTYEAKLLTV